MPSPSETCFRGMCMGRSFQRVWAGLTLERFSQLVVFATQAIGWDAAAVWLVEDDVRRCAPLSSSNLVPSERWRHARGKEHCRGEPGIALYRVDAHQIRRGRRAARSSTSQGSAEPLCARIKGANREVSEGKADPWLRSVFFLLRRPTRSDERAIFMGLFFWNAQGF